MIFAPTYSYSNQFFVTYICRLVALYSSGNSTSDLILYFFIVWVVCLFLSQGPHVPFGNINSWLMETFRVSRSSGIVTKNLGTGWFGVWQFWWDMESRVLSNYIRHPWRQRLFIILMIIGMAGVNVWPAWTGDLIRSKETLAMPFFANIPPSYYEAAYKLDEDTGNSYTYIVPRSGYWPHNVYTWGYSSVELLSQLSTRANVVAVLSPQNKPFDIGGVVYDALRNGYPQPEKLLGALNIGHIVVHKDIDLTFMRVESPSIFLDQFDRVEDLLISYDSPELNIYELSKYNPQIFATRNIIYSIGNFRDLPAVVSLDNYDQTKAILFTRQYGQDNQIAYSDDFSPFTMSINPSNVVINAQPTQNLDMYELSIPFVQTV